MTRDTQVVDIIETNKKPSPIGFLSSYLPSSSKKKATTTEGKFSPPYPVDASLSGTFPAPCSMPMPSKHNNFVDVELNEISASPSAPIILDLEKGPTQYEKQEIEKELSLLKSRMLGKSDDEKREFLNHQHKLLTKIDSIKFKLSAEERKDFAKKMREIDEIRMINMDDGNVQNDEEIGRKKSSDEMSETNTKCAFDISSLLPKFPQLVVDIVICVKGAMKGLMNVTGATYFTISLSAALFTAYYLILFCTCRRTKRTRISEFLHSFICTFVFLIVSFCSTADEQLRAFGFLASVPYGSEVCWKFWNYLFKKKF